MTLFRPDQRRQFRRLEWRRRGRLLLIGTLLGALVSTAGVGYHHLRQFFALALPATPPINVWDVLYHAEVLPVTVGGHAAGAPWTATPKALRGSPALWQRMHLADWNGVPQPLREESLAVMLAQHRDLVASPVAWQRMTPAAWDYIPQPVRTVAYRNMVAYWASFYEVGAAYQLPAPEVADTLAAIVMSESWFDHRAGVAYDNGNRDIGLAQASTFARERVRALQRRGRIDIALDDEDYRNPWHATRFVALWMALMIEEADGDLDTAVRAYNRGIGRANDALGTAYWTTVQERLERYIRNVDAPAAWDYVWRAARTLAEDALPGVAQHSVEQVARQTDTVRP